MGEMCLFGGWALFLFFFFYFESMVEKREMEPGRTVGVYWGGTYPLKRGKM